MDVSDVSMKFKYHLLPQYVYHSIYYIDSYNSLLNTSAVLYNSYFFPMTVAQKTE